MTLAFFNDSPPSRGASDPSPGGQRTTLPARGVGHGTRYSPGTEKGCWVGGTRGATARPREAEWSSRFAAVFGCVNKNIVKDPNDYQVLLTTTSQAYCFEIYKDNKKDMLSA